MVNNLLYELPKTLAFLVNYLVGDLREDVA